MVVCICGWWVRAGGAASTELVLPPGTPQLTPQDLTRKSTPDFVEHFKQHVMSIVGIFELVVPELVADTEFVVRFRVASQVGDTDFGWPERVGSRAAK